MSRKPLNTPFRQQTLKAQQPMYGRRHLMVLSYLLSLLFALLAGITRYYGSAVQTKVQRYDNCTADASSGTCRIDILIEEEMEQPVYVMYELTNFYQNHRDYVNSKSRAQLRGEEVHYDDLSDCFPRISLDNRHEDKYIYYPCGIIAPSRFTDELRILKDGREIPSTDDGVCWASDLETQYLYPQHPVEGIIVVENIRDPDFVVWMKTAAYKRFHKNYKKITQNLEPGVYTLETDNKYPSASIQSQKNVIITTVSHMGGQNRGLYRITLALALVLGAIGILLTVSKGSSIQKDWIEEVAEKPKEAVNELLVPLLQE